MKISETHVFYKEMIEFFEKFDNNYFLVQVDKTYPDKNLYNVLNKTQFKSIVPLTLDNDTTTCFFALNPFPCAIFNTYGKFEYILPAVHASKLSK